MHGGWYIEWGMSEGGECGKEVGVQLAGCRMGRPLAARPLSRRLLGRHLRGGRAVEAVDGGGVLWARKTRVGAEE